MLRKQYDMRFVLTVFLGSVVSPLTLTIMPLAAESKESGETMTVTAEQELKQQPGVSVITKEDLEKKPPINDLSELIRKMPGVNLTGNSATGSRGNNRQIDLRGMGPENTLILIDGRPVASRNAVRYSWDGERDTRGNTNWVPAEEVERIEVIRGPAAARYGSGTAGGVVNIITRRPGEKWSGSVSLFTNQPADNKEGATRRANFSLSGPLLDDTLTMRLFGNINKTDADSWNINPHSERTTAAGREGVRNKDINGLLSWTLSPQQTIDLNASYSRQGNIYTGDTQLSSASEITEALAKREQETNRMYRQSYAMTHNGFWSWGQSKFDVYYEQTNNTRLEEGLYGRSEGAITDDAKFNTSRFKNSRISGEVNIPFDNYLTQTVTMGMHWDREQLSDPSANSYTGETGDNIAGVSADPDQRQSKNSAELLGIYLEDNLEPQDGTKIIPGIRFNYYNNTGANWSPSLNIQQALNDMLSLKAGIARSYKTPNLYQSSPGYLLYSYGAGCPTALTQSSCYLVGNQEVKPEISVNKEIGLEFNHNGYLAGLTWFRNDYRNKIISGTDRVGITRSGANVFTWENGGKAVIQGLEANLKVPIIDDRLDWSTNATYMIESKSKATGNPLSIIPKYTVNSQLDWQINKQWSTTLDWTLYGRQKPMQNATNWFSAEGGLSQREVGSYSLIGLGANYQFNKAIRLNTGIRNLFNKQLYRYAEGASTYNEPGRAYYAGITATF